MSRNNQELQQPQRGVVPFEPIGPIYSFYKATERLTEEKVQPDNGANSDGAQTVVHELPQS
ncbi:hypothetical protein FQN49_008303 [Arthroderma sp. PD_2]|nr:hypothetical protein FQN49_008303 [Arthroderma sp. PD_2]